MGTLFRVSVETGEVLGQCVIGEGPEAYYGHRMEEVAVSPDGRVVAAGCGPLGEVYFWDAKTLKKIATMWTEDGTTLGMVFSPDGTGLATYGVDCENEVRIRDVSFLGNDQELPPE